MRSAIFVGSPGGALAEIFSWGDGESGALGKNAKSLAMI